MSARDDEKAANTGRRRKPRVALSENARDGRESCQSQLIIFIYCTEFMWVSFVLLLILLFIYIFFLSLKGIYSSVCIGRDTVEGDCG